MEGIDNVWPRREEPAAVGEPAPVDTNRQPAIEGKTPISEFEPGVPSAMGEGGSWTRQTDLKGNVWYTPTANPISDFEIQN